jgi:hypothetical protein
MLLDCARRSAKMAFFLVAGLGIAGLVAGGCPNTGTTGDNGDTGNDGQTPTEWTLTEITTNTTIPAGSYRVNASMRVRNGALLTIAPGVTLEFGTGYGLFVENTGALSAIGTAASPITLTGQTKVAGAWVGLRFDGSGSTANNLQYVTVAYGGAESGGLSSNLLISGAAQVSVTHCTLSDGSTYGFTFRATLSDYPTVTFEYNTITRNGSGAGQVPPRLVGVLTTTSTYTGNTTERVSVITGDSGVDQIWQALGVDYAVAGTVRLDHNTSFAAGIHLVFPPGAGLFVQGTGALTAVGTATSPILLTCTDKTAGAWVGVRFASASANNRLKYATVEYGGYDSGGLRAGVLVDLNSVAVVEFCTIQYSANFGLWQRSSGSLTQSNNTFVGNGAVDVRMD